MSILRCWILFLCMPFSIASQPIAGQFSLDWDLRGTLSSPLSGFWGQYQQYAFDTPPMATLRMGLEEPDHWKVYSELVFRQQFGGWQATNATIPVPGRRQVVVDFHAIQAGYLRYNFQPLEATFGRDKLHYGPMDHSLVISDQVPFLDMLRLKLPMGDFLLDYALTSPETREGTEADFTKTAFFTLHRFQWSRDGLTLAFVEQSLIDRGVYKLTDFLPVFLIHQGDVQPFNTSMSIDADWQITPEWRVSGQLGSDEADAALFGIPDTDNPSITAYILGAEFKLPGLRWYVEVGETHYLWGNYDADKPNSKAKYRILLDNGVQTLFLTSPYGPGTQWFTTTVKVEDGPWTLSSNIEVWKTLAGVDLDRDYPGTPPDPSAFNVSGRYSIEGTWELGGWILSTGPALLQRNELLNPQWKFGLKTSRKVNP